jgi:hypothetical protein
VLRSHGIDPVATPGPANPEVTEGAAPINCDEYLLSRKNKIVPENFAQHEKYLEPEA